MHLFYSEPEHLVTSRVKLFACLSLSPTHSHCQMARKSLNPSLVLVNYREKVTLERDENVGSGV